MVKRDLYASLAIDVDEVADDDGRNPLLGWLPTKPIREWMSDPSRKKALRGPNQLGKTEAGAVELLHRMRGTHPYLKTHAPPIATWVVCSSWRQSLIIQEKIWNFIPKDELDPAVHFTVKNGFSGRWFGLKNGSTCQIVTVNQETPDLASATLHFIWPDELLVEHVWSELCARLTHHRGTIGLTFTPIGRPVDWLKEKCEAGEIADHHFTLTVENATPLGSRIPFRSQVAIDEFRKDCLNIERAQRCEAAWEGAAGERVLEAFDEHLIADDCPPGLVVEFAVGIDHGAKAGRQSAVLAACAVIAGKPRLWILDEAYSDGRTGTEEDARNILSMLARNGLSLKNVDHWRGDRPHSGDWRGNQKSNRDLKRAFATILGLRSLDQLPPPLQRISVPQKWQGSVAYGCRLINKLFAEDRCTISPKAVGVIEACKGWEGALQDPLKDRIDAMRYAAEVLVDARLVWGAHSTFALNAA